MKKLFVLAFAFLAITCVVIAQTPNPPLDQVLTTVLDVPKSSGQTIQSLFVQWSTWLSAIVVMLTVYFAQWIPGIANVLSLVKPYFRALIVGGALIAVMITYRNADGTQATLSFILSNVIYEILKLLGNFIDFSPPPTYTDQIVAVREDLSNIQI